MHSKSPSRKLLPRSASPPHTLTHPIQPTKPAKKDLSSDPSKLGTRLLSPSWIEPLGMIRIVADYTPSGDVTYTIPPDLVTETSVWRSPN
ncbi:hypothetical protein HBI56_122220 [Parastagonospora nodorum]|uniref:Uncharacterized protein n=1 Tax=Phaeosphaeria nodorum (strain SN15 / ATCC MYA-4574 / FGSC 10173) TaxID=321614 RepID=A0A7U2FBF6_PHANO|nr:hypothetical protein HBH56_052480 [Parastagonospora nodorum]QRD02183.1 hypothetical protein JI435_417640 [Parastagonospora nodorum SN15]KAH3935610.1 hypothetical protein HBH54_038280 [Parastagonospora nodorum]KAH4053541.1 hypothetical protein HBH49_085100 [Parastagonospora nodorum]KAH4067332.1 hypothetical protein HBH50_138740 [Parastagonospora nodorum]